MPAVIEQCWIYRSAAPQPSGQLPRWGAKNVLPLNLIALPAGDIFCASPLHVAVLANGKSQSLFIVDYSYKNKLTIYISIDTI